MAEKLVLHPRTKHYPHFLGAVLRQQVQNASGTMLERIIINDFDLNVLPEDSSLFAFVDL